VSYPDDTLVAKQIVLKCKEKIRKERLGSVCITLLPETKNLFSNMNISSHQPPGWSAGVMTIDLQQNNPQTIWNNFLSKDDRRKINLPERDGWKIEEAKTEEDYKNFYTYYRANLQYLNIRNMRDFSFFTYLMKTFSPNEMLLLLLRKDETIAGGMLNFLYEPKKTMYCAYAALNRELSTRYSPFVSLMWHVVKKASAIGYDTVSFGGTPPPPDVHYRIKAKFGCRFEPQYEVSFPRLGAIVNSAASRLDTIIHTISATQLLPQNRERTFS
jgi:lipid II:glycine glycyltransferase (peptidoglycan interpeptide bridge formation enzyme)